MTTSTAWERTPWRAEPRVWRAVPSSGARGDDKIWNVLVGEMLCRDTVDPSEARPSQAELSLPQSVPS